MGRFRSILPMDMDGHGAHRNLGVAVSVNGPDYDSDMDVVASSISAVSVSRLVANPDLVGRVFCMASFETERVAIRFQTREYPVNRHLAGYCYPC